MSQLVPLNSSHEQWFNIYHAGLTSPSPSNLVDMQCFFSGEVGNKIELRKAATLGLDKKFKDCAVFLGDKHL